MGIILWQMSNVHLDTFATNQQNVSDRAPHSLAGHSAVPVVLAEHGSLFGSLCLLFVFLAVDVAIALDDVVVLVTLLGQ